MQEEKTQHQKLVLHTRPWGYSSIHQEADSDLDAKNWKKFGIPFERNPVHAFFSFSDVKKYVPNFGSSFKRSFLAVFAQNPAKLSHGIPKMLNIDLCGLVKQSTSQLTQNASTMDLSSFNYCSQECVKGTEIFVLSIVVDQKRFWQTRVARIVYVKKKTCMA